MISTALLHYACVGCEMDAIMDMAGRHNIAVMEDSAHGLFGKYKRQYLGAFGSLVSQSFREIKNFTSEDDGTLLINDPVLVERAEIIREKCTNRSCFFRGQVDKYTWVDIGSSYLPPDILSAFLFAQFKQWQKIQLHRKRVRDLCYADALFLFDYCKRNFSKNIALLHDYRLYDFTILVRKAT